MGATTKIEWCDHTASPWYGCAHVHAGCDNCYAETMSKRNPGTLGIWGTDGVRVKSKSFIGSLHKWQREAEAAGKVVSVFPSLCDPFEDRPELEPWRAEMFAAIDRCPNVRLLLLTKRPGNVHRMWPPRWGEPCPKCGLSLCDHDEDPVDNCRAARRRTPGNYHRPNVWLGASVSDQATFDELMPELLELRRLTPVLFLSAEPLLGPVRIGRYTWTRAELAAANSVGMGWQQSFQWMIVGGESGRGARPCMVEWIASLRDQCAEAGISCFVKQLGSYPVQIDTKYGTVGLVPDYPVSAQWYADKKGGDWAEWPADLRVRQFPAARTPA